MLLLLLLRNKHIPHSTSQQNCSTDKYALKGFDWEESNIHYFCLLQNMLMNPKSLGPWCYYLALKSDHFTSHAPIKHVLKLVHKPRCELKSHRTVSTCWLQGWINFAASESKGSTWQLFCFIQALATGLFGHTSLTGADKAVRALINSISWGTPSCSPVHHTAHPPQDSSPKVTCPSELTVPPVSGVCAPGRVITFPSLRSHRSPGGKSSTASRDGGWALFY